MGQGVALALVRNKVGSGEYEGQVESWLIPAVATYRYLFFPVVSVFYRKKTRFEQVYSLQITGTHERSSLDEELGRDAGLPCRSPEQSPESAAGRRG